MKKGFTMIELIFVIVILGILAAVAIPRLAATRNDATAATVATSAATCVNDAGGAYMMDGAFDITSPACVDAITTSGCYNIAGVDATGVLTISTTSASNSAGTAVCELAAALSDVNGLTNSTTDVTHNF